MANEQNLIPLDKRAKSEQRAIQSMGGKARAEKARKRKTMREAMELIAEQPLTNERLRKSIKAVTGGIEDEDIDMITAATMGVFQAAIKGNVKAYDAIERMLSDGIDDMEEEDDLSKALRELGESL